MKTQMIAALMIGMASVASAQPARRRQRAPGRIYRHHGRRIRKMDGDKDGKVTRAEIESFERGAVLSQARARAQALFAQLDADRNGQLSAAEFGKMVTGSPQVDGRPLLGKLDTNKDGTVSLIEHRAGKLAYFDQIDSDKDGVVTVAEMKAAGVIK